MPPGGPADPDRVPPPVPDGIGAEIGARPGPAAAERGTAGRAREPGRRWQPDPRLAKHVAPRFPDRSPFPMSLVPFLLERRLVPKPWGGTRLARFVGVSPGPEPIGESWEIYDRGPTDSSVVRGAPGGTLHGLVEEWGEELLGAGVRPTPAGRFPLSIKLIDAGRTLSVQVHPDEEQGVELGDCGKSEAWVVLEAGPGARIVHGLTDGVTLEELGRLAGTAGIERALRPFAPRVGDAIWVPPGTVHAIGPGVLVYEVQRNSDVTLRLWDWGRPRELHIEQAMRALRLASVAVPATPRALERGVESLVEDPWFRLRRVRPEGPTSLKTEGRFLAVTLLEGRATLGWRSGGRDAPLLLQRGDTAIVPAAIEAVFLSPAGDTTLLVAGPQEE